MKLAVKEERCSGCRACELVCSMRHFSQPNPKRAGIRITGSFPAPGRYSIAYCDQCGVCAEVCPASAIHEVDDHYEIDPGLCTGCMLCVDECPQGAMSSHPDSEVPFKCVACGDCVAYCPTRALVDEDGQVAWAGTEAKKKAQASGR